MAQQFFRTVNPHLLSAVVAAGRSHDIAASRDLVDESGAVLWPRGRRVDETLAPCLLERKLRHPLEVCLGARDGLDSRELHAAYLAFAESDDGLACAVKPWVQWLGDDVPRLSLHPVAQLLLTVARATRPHSFEHAVRGMVLAGAMSASAGSSRQDLQLALLGGLLHDVAELYVPPHCLDTAHALDARSFKQMAVHPRIGELVLGSLTDYPGALARAVGEHHERLNGSGYPSQRTAASMSPLGRLLAVVETTLGVASTTCAPCARSSLALRLVPGEFDGAWDGFIAAASQRAQEDLEAATLDESGDALDQLALMDAQLALAAEQAVALEKGEASSMVVTHVATRAHGMLDRLRAGWNAMGLWSVLQADGPAQALFEIRVVRQELRYRMRRIQRECLWPESDLSVRDALRLEPLWAFLAPQAHAAAPA